MPKFRVTSPEGVSSVVEAPTQAEAIAMAKGQAKPPTAFGYPVVGERSDIIKPSVGTLVKEGVKRRSGDIAGMTAATVMPWRGAAGLAARILGSEAGQDIGDVATGQKVTPGYGAASQLVGEGAGRAVAPFLSPKTFRSYAARSAKDLGDALKELVPSWKGFASTGKGLYEMVHTTGPRLLSEGFHKAITGIKGAIPDTFVVNVPEWLETAGRVELITKPRNARALIDDLPALRQAGGKPYRNALKALAEELPTGLSPELDAARSEYKSGSGWIEFGERGKFLHGEKYDPAKAQKALDSFGRTVLLGRGMDDIRALVRGPGRQPIEAAKHNPFVRRLEGGLLGGALGFPLGIPHAIGGAAGGVVAGEMMPLTTYRNVPLTPAAKFAGRLGTAGVAEGLREAGRDLGIKEQLPGVGGP